jgi:hypothetical protein
MGMVQRILQQAGGLRGLAAGAAIAWGTAQATSLAEQAQAAAAEAGEALQTLTAQCQEKAAELAQLQETEQAFRIRIRREILAGAHDNTVMQRAATIQAAETIAEEVSEVDGQSTLPEIDG